MTQDEIRRELLEALAEGQSGEVFVELAERPRWRDPVIWLLATITILLLPTAVGFIGRLTEPDTIYYANLPFPVSSPVRAGDALAIDVSRCNRTDEPHDFTYTRLLHSLDGGRDYTLSDGAALALPGCTRSTNMSVTLPVGMAPGRYELIGITRTTQTWRDHTVTYRSAEFRVE